MGLLGKIFGFGRKSASVSSSLDLFREVFGGRESRAGVAVNIETALETSVVLAICRVLADGVSQVPFKLFRETADGSETARDHPLYDLLSLRPNPWQTSFEFRETLMFHLALCNNAFVFVNRIGGDRKIAELIPIEPGKVSVKQEDDYRLVYKVKSSTGPQVEFPAEAIWHLRGPSWNSWMGMDAVKLARNAIGLSIAIEQGQSDFQKNGAKTSGLFAVKNALSPERYEQLRKFFEDEIAKSDGFRPLILDNDASFTPFTMNGVDQQLLETRKHQVEEICRQFRVMPIMVGQADKAATYASSEQMFLAHVVHTLSPWYMRIEQSANVNLLTDVERKSGLYSKFVINALMRGAAADRATYYTKALGAGGTGAWMTQNEVRALEELNRHPDGDALAKPNVNSTNPTPPTPEGNP